MTVRYTLAVLNKLRHAKRLPVLADWYEGHDALVVAIDKMMATADTSLYLELSEVLHPRDELPGNIALKKMGM